MNVPRALPAPSTAIRAQLLSSVAAEPVGSDGNLTFTRPIPSGSLLLVTRPTTRFWLQSRRSGGRIRSSSVRVGGPGDAEVRLVAAARRVLVGDAGDDVLAAEAGADVLDLHLAPRAQLGVAERGALGLDDRVGLALAQRLGQRIGLARVLDDARGLEHLRRRRTRTGPSCVDERASWSRSACEVRLLADDLLLALRVPAADDDLGRDLGDGRARAEGHQVLAQLQRQRGGRSGWRARTCTCRSRARSGSRSRARTGRSARAGSRPCA